MPLECPTMPLECHTPTMTGVGVPNSRLLGGASRDREYPLHASAHRGALSSPL